ncbi:MAG: TolB family protein, partial [Acidimicrobiia bacterium]
TDTEQASRYRELLGRGLVEPRQLDIYIMQADGSDRRRLTQNGKANFAPFFHPDGKRVIFSSNINDPRGRDFDLFIINTDGTRLEQVTANPTFDGFPVFSSDGRRLLFSSNRNGKVTGETNIFIADWVN